MNWPPGIVLLRDAAVAVCAATAAGLLAAAWRAAAPRRTAPARGR